MFGAFLTPQPEVVASELFRVVRPGNTVGLTAWAADSVFIRLFQVAAALPAAARGHAAAGGVGRRGRSCGRGSKGSRRTWRSSGARSSGPATPEVLAAELIDSAPTYAAAREALSGEDFDALGRDALELLRELDRGDGHIEADYLVVVARKRG